MVTATQLVMPPLKPNSPMERTILTNCAMKVGSPLPLLRWSSDRHAFRRGGRVVGTKFQAKQHINKLI